MAQQLISREKNKSIIFLAIFSVGLFAFIFIGIYPRYKLLKQTERRIDELSSQISRQKEILPALAMQFQEMTQLKLPEGLLFPDKTALEEKEKILSDIQELSIQNSISVENIVFESNNETAVILLATIKPENDDKDSFLKFHHFLIKLGSLPYIDRIERLSIRAADQIKKIEIRLRFVKK